MKRIIAMLLVMASLLGMMAGCKPLGDIQTPGTEPQTETTAPQETTVPEGPGGNGSGGENTPDSPTVSPTTPAAPTVPTEPDGPEVTTVPGEGGQPQGGSTPSATTYAVRFYTNGGDEIAPRQVAKGTLISSLPTPYREGHVFVSWYYDQGFTKQALDSDAVNGPVTLYAKYNVQEIPSEAGGNSFTSSMDEKPSFTIVLESSDPALTAEQVKNLIRAKNVSQPDAVNFINVTGGNGVYTVSGSNGFQAGSTFQLLLEDGRLSFKDQSKNVREYNFTIQKESVVNLQLVDGIIYIPADQISNITGNGKEVKSLNLAMYTIDTEGNLQDAETTSGQFTYAGTLQVDDTVVVYSGIRPDLRDENTNADDAGEVAYIKITAVNGNTYSYVNAKTEDVLMRPDLLPVSVDHDTDTASTTVTLENQYLDFSDDIYTNIRLDANTTVDVGDFIVFHDGEFSMSGSDILGYAQITGVTVNGGMTVISYRECAWETVESSMDLRTEESISGEKMLEGVDVEALEQQIAEQAENSGFAQEVATYMVAVATAAENIEHLPEDFKLSDIRVVLSDGTEVDPSYLQLMGDKVEAKVSLSKLDVEISTDLKHFDEGGVRVALLVGAKITYIPKTAPNEDPADKAVFLEVIGTMEQEVRVAMDFDAYAIWDNWGPFFYIRDYHISAAIDLLTYTGMGFDANVGTQERLHTGEYTGVVKYDKFIDNVLKALKVGKAVMYDTDINLTDDLVEKYTQLLSNQTDWIYIVDQPFMEFNISIPAIFPIVVIEMKTSFVVSVDASVALGLDIYYKNGNRYLFALDLFSMNLHHDVVSLYEETFGLDLYAMGRLGLRAGVRVELMLGLLDTSFASAGVYAEGGAYVKTYGYLYYDLLYAASDGVSQSLSGAAYLEVGGYFELGMEAQAFGNLFNFSPDPWVENEVPIWAAGQRDNVLDFSTEQKDFPEINMKKYIKTVQLGDDLFTMEYLDLKEGGLHTGVYDDGDCFEISFNNQKFSYEPATNTVRVSPSEDDVKLEAVMTITWSRNSSAFSTKPITRTLKVTWDNLRDGYMIVPYTNGGSYVPTYNQAYESAVKAPADPVKQGYVFAGWYRDEACTVPYIFPETMPAEDTNIYAAWTPATDTRYHVAHYQQILGSSTYELLEKESFTGVTDSIVRPEPHTYTGFITPAKQQAVILPDGSTTVYYYYDRIVSTVTFDGGTASDESKSFLLQYGAKVYPPQIAVDGYDFLGWDQEVSPVMGDRSVTYVAQWKKSNVEYRVEYYVQQPDGRYTLQEQIYNSGVIGSSVTENTLLNGLTLENGKTAAQTYPAPGNVQFDCITVNGINLTVEGKAPVLEKNTVIKVRFARMTHTATFRPENGQEPAQIVLYSGAAMTAPQEPVREGYVFAGWSPELPAVMGTEDAVYTALWQKNAYTVTFHPAGGTGTMEPQGFLYDTPAKLAKNSFTRSGYSFAGWTAHLGTSAEFADGVEVSNLTAVQGGNVDLYAVWTPIVYSITYILNGGSGSSNPESYTVLDTIHLSAPSRTGYSFTGWQTEDGKLVSQLLPGTVGDLTLTATWKANTNTAYAVEHYLEDLGKDTYTLDKRQSFSGTTDSSVTPKTLSYEGFTAPKTQTVTVKADGSLVVKYYYSRNSYTLTLVYNDGKTANSVTKAEYGQSIQVPAPTRTGYGFTGWDQAVPATMPAKDLTLTAAWKANRYTVSFYTVSGSLYTKLTQDYGTAIKAPADPTRNGYSFAGWDVAIPATMPAKDMAITAKWTVVSYTIRYNLNGGTNNSANPVSYTVEQGVTLKAPARIGYSFMGWTDANGKTVTAISVGSTGNVTLTASWKANTDTAYAVEHHLQDVGKETYTLAETQSFSGTTDNSVTPKTLTYTGFTAPKAQTVTVKADGSLVVKYYYSRNSYTLTFVYNDGETANTTLTAQYGQDITLPVPARSGYGFAGWFVNENLTGDADTARIMGAENKTLYAKWSANEYSYTVNHYQQNVDGKGYTLVSSVSLSAAMDSVQSPKVNSYEGFTSPQQQSITIDISGNAVHYYYTRNQHQLTWNGNGGSGNTGSTKVYFGAAITAPNLEKTGYSFAGWDQTVPATMPAKDLTLTANWTVKQYTVSFYTVSGSLYIKQTVDYGTAIQAPADPTRTGYRFAGWDQAIPATMPAKDMAITAKWTVLSYTIRYNLNGGTNNSANPVSYTVEQGVTLEAPTKAGYSFTGWTDESGKTVASIAVGSTGDLMLTASWKADTNTVYTVEHYLQDLGKDTYTLTDRQSLTGTTDSSVTPATQTYQGFTAPDVQTVTIQANGKTVVQYYYTRNQYYLVWLPNGGSGNATGGYVYYGAPLTAPVVTRTGYTFLRWSVDVPATMPARDMTFMAKWQINQYTIRYYTTSGNLYAERTYDYGKSIPIMIAPKRDGYTFGGWDSKVPATMPDQNLTFTATWNAVPYAIVYELNGGENNSANPASYTIEQSVILKAPSRTGYTFTGWTDESGKTVTAISVGSTGARKLIANWKANTYSISFHSNDGFGKTVTQSGFGYDMAANLTANSFTRNGYSFAGWAVTTSGALCYTDGQEILNLTAEQNGIVHLYAVWTPNRYSIFYDLANGIENHPDNPDSYEMDGTVALKAPANAPAGKHFGGWYTDKALTNPAAMEFTVSVAGGLTLYPKWVDNHYKLDFYAFRKDINIPDAQQVVEYSTAGNIWSVDQLNTTSANRFVNPGYTLTGWSFWENTAADIPANATIAQLMEALRDRLPVDDYSSIELHAVWTLDEHKVEFERGTDPGVSAVPETITFHVLSGEIVLPAPTVKPGYQFVGWYTNAACTGTPVKSVSAGSYQDLKLYPKCSLISYSITYNLNGGVHKGSYTTKYDVTDTIVIATPEYATYPEYNHFVGWFEDAACTKAFTNDLKQNPRNVTLYAKWDLCKVYNSIDSTPFEIAGRVILDWRNESELNLYNHTKREVRNNRYNNIDLSGATEVIFIGKPEKTFQNFIMHLCNYKSNQNVTLRFVDFNFIANEATAIGLWNDAGCSVTMIAEGSCSIGTNVAGGSIIGTSDGKISDLSFAGTGTLTLSAGNGGASGNGGTAVYAKTVRTSSNKLTLNIYGGHGGNGANGQNGSTDCAGWNGHNGGNGGHAIHADKAYLNNGVIKLSGGNGGNGGNGGRGGDGKAAVKDSERTDGRRGGDGGDGGANGVGLYAISGSGSSKVSIVDGKNGSGGRGGDGGTGGRNTFSAFWCTVQNGGDGGDGGDSGKRLVTKIAWANVSSNGKGSVGLAGNGGSKGGYDGWWAANDAHDGNPGDKGSEGKEEHVGIFTPDISII